MLLPSPDQGGNEKTAAVRRLSPKTVSADGANAPQLNRGVT